MSSSTTTDDNDKLFFTTSDLLNRLNQNLTELDSDDGMNPRVELQRRLPDGSTKKASSQDLAAADMQTKFNQAAQQVSGLSPEQKLQWAQGQRLEGNKLYEKQQYHEAIDVYLTCLIVKPSQGDGDAEQFYIQVFLPVLNNLATCCIKLCMWKKTEKFCTIGLEERSVPKDTNDRLPVSKLYFKRAKARRMQGLYKEAKSDLNQCLELLSTNAEKERNAVQQERQLLEIAQARGRQNEKDQKQAMKAALGGPSTVLSATSTSQNARQRRTYSTLKAKRPIQQEERKEDVSLSYWQHYRLVVARLAQLALDYIGDDEEDDERDKND